jgi:N-acetylmuramoyl-L-alanine amidase
VESQPAFLSNPRDDSLLAQDDFRWKVAWGLRNGIIKCMENP